jgi:hypothetical protein
MLKNTRLSDMTLLTPYSILQQYRRTSRFLRNLKHVSSLPIFILDAQTNLKSGSARYKIDTEFLATCTSKYSAIICKDPVAFSDVLRGIYLPRINVASVKDVENYPEMLSISEYLLPSFENHHLA